MASFEDRVEEVLEWSDRHRLYGRKFYPRLSREEYSRMQFPEVWEDIDRARARIGAAKRDSLYFDPYTQATGEFLEYACGRPIGEQ